MTGMDNGALGADLEPLVIDDRERRLFRVSRRAMVDPAVFALERERIFEKTWLYLGHESEVPHAGDFLTRTLIERPLLICRGSDGKVRVLVNACPHRGNVVCRQARGNAKTFQCFYHFWTFKNTGQLNSIPDAGAYAASLDRSELGLKEVPRTANYKGFIFISFNPDVPDIETHLAGARPYLDAVADQGEHGMEVLPGSQLYSMRANWKLLPENTIDFYHTPKVHTTYFAFLRAQGMDVTSPLVGRGYDLGNGHAVVEYRASWGRPIARWEPRFGEGAKPELAEVRARLVDRYGEQRAHIMADTDRNLFIFPNLLINDIMAIVLRWINPISESYMEVTQWALAPVGETPEARARRLESFLTFLGPGGFSTPDDNEALEGCQRGYGAWRESGWSDLSRGYALELDGRGEELKCDDEVQLRAFYRHWAHLVGGASAVASTSARAEATSANLQGVEVVVVR